MQLPSFFPFVTIDALVNSALCEQSHAGPEPSDLGPTDGSIDPPQALLQVAGVVVLEVGRCTDSA